MEMRDSWYVAAWSSELTDAPLGRRVLGEPLVLFRRSDGSVVALDDMCPHRYAPLSLGKVTGDTLQCGYHGMQFNAAGRCVFVPGGQRISERATVRSYPVVERDTWIWVWLGDPARADSSTIPDFHWLDDPEWVVTTGVLRFGASFVLINDNLLDLTHETFVHASSIGAHAVAESPLTVRTVEDAAGPSVEAHRDMPDCEPSPVLAAIYGGGRVNRWHTTIYRPPGFLVVKTGAWPAGRDENAEDYRTRVLNAITPETDTSSHYFFATAIVHHKAQRDPEWLAARTRGMMRVFLEDQAMLEGQQAMMTERGLTGDVFPVSIAADAGATQGRKLLRRWLAEKDAPLASLARS
jgi:phenylpropionate dioxygenase-like ring-hydroxylating dioxygenase large terminal subunit